VADVREVVNRLAVVLHLAHLLIDWLSGAGR
jgi:hypothetical protein